MTQNSLAFDLQTTVYISWLCTELLQRNITAQRHKEPDGIVRPNNAVVLVGSRVVIPCKANVDNESRWDYYQSQSNDMSNVYNGNKVNDIHSRRFNIDLDSCKLRVCDLLIRSVQLEDAGFFVCFQPSIKIRMAAALVVLGRCHFYSPSNINY